MDINDQTLTFSTGKTRHIVCGVIGIDADLDVHAGYDDTLLRQATPDLERDGYAEHYDEAIYGAEKWLTRGERIELAEYMIQLWTRFLHVQQTEE